MIKILVNGAKISYKVFKYLTVAGDVVDLYDVVQKKRSAKAEKKTKKLTTLVIAEYEDLTKRTMGEYTFEVNNLSEMTNGRNLHVCKDGVFICSIAIDILTKEEVKGLLSSLPFTIEFLSK